jgi:hypothetical protein
MIYFKALPGARCLEDDKGGDGIFLGDRFVLCVDVDSRLRGNDKVKKVNCGARETALGYKKGVDDLVVC